MNREQAELIAEEATSAADAAVAAQGLDPYSPEGEALSDKIMFATLAARLGDTTANDFFDALNGRAGAYPAPPLQ